MGGSAAGARSFVGGSLSQVFERAPALFDDGSAGTRGLVGGIDQPSLKRFKLFLNAG